MTVTATAQPLERRRDKAAAASAAADKAQAAVTDVDNQLKTLAGLTGQQEQSLRRAVDEAARLKRALKAAAKRRAELVKERKKAVAKANRARRKAKAAETKYDQEVLSDLVRREKERDRAAPDAAGSRADPAPERSVTSVARSVAAKVTAAKSARTQGRAPAADPPPERESEATTTARRTAASKTAAAARSPR